MCALLVLTAHPGPSAPGRLQGRSPQIDPFARALDVSPHPWWWVAHLNLNHFFIHNLRSSPYHAATTYRGRSGLPSMRLTGGATDQTVPRQDVNSPFTSCVCHPEKKKVFAHTQVRDARGPAAPVKNASGTSSIWLSDPVFVRWVLVRWALFKSLISVFCTKLLDSLHGQFPNDKNEFVFESLLNILLSTFQFFFDE